MTDSNKLRIGVIGCGHWGPNHIRTFSALPDSTVIAVADTSPERLAQMRAMYPSLVTCCCYEELLETAPVDAVVVATPATTHFPIVRAAIRAGKHVLCEKPLCPTAAEGDTLREQAAARDIVLMVGHVFLFNPGVAKLKELVDSGRLGDLRYLASVRTNLGPIRHDVDVVWDLASHDVSIFNWLLDGEPEWVSATGGSYIQPNLADVAFVALGYSGGAVAHVQVSWLNPKKVRSMSVVGSKRMATWDDLDLATPVAVYEKGAGAETEYSNYGEFMRVAMWDGDVHLPKIALEEPLRAQARAFLQAVRDGRVERSDAAFAVGVLRTLEAVEQSLMQRGAAVEVARA